MLWPCICSKPSPTTALCSSRRILHVVRSCSIYIVVIRPPSSTPTSCCDKRSTSQTSVDKRYSTSKCTTSWARHDVHDPLVCIGQEGQQHCLHTPHQHRVRCLWPLLDPLPPSLPPERSLPVAAAPPKKTARSAWRPDKEYHRRRPSSRNLASRWCPSFRPSTRSPKRRGNITITSISLRW